MTSNAQYCTCPICHKRVKMFVAGGSSAPWLRLHRVPNTSRICNGTRMAVEVPQKLEKAT
jgi:hypothetical protein